MDRITAGFVNRIARHIEAVLADPAGRDAWDEASIFVLEATRVAFVAALDERAGHFHIAAAAYWLGSAWMDVVSIDPDWIATPADQFENATKHLRAGELELSRPTMTSLTDLGNLSLVSNNVVPFPGRYHYQKMKAKDAACASAPICGTQLNRLLQLANDAAARMKIVSAIALNIFGRSLQIGAEPGLTRQ